MTGMPPRSRCCSTAGWRACRGRWWRWPTGTASTTCSIGARASSSPAGPTSTRTGPRGWTRRAGPSCGRTPSRPRPGRPSRPTSTGPATGSARATARPPACSTWRPARWGPGTTSTPSATRRGATSLAAGRRSSGATRPRARSRRWTPSPGWSAGAFRCFPRRGPGCSRPGAGWSSGAATRVRSSRWTRGAAARSGTSRPAA